MGTQTDLERKAVADAAARLLKPLMERTGVHMACVILAFEGPRDGLTFVATHGTATPGDFMDFVDALPELAHSYRQSVITNDRSVTYERIDPTAPGD